ncbi:hypothetical protein KC19_11G053600 [Ceratodon purpureus]|uniref:WD repeat domain phosphoinositide-interacting protein 3 n=1 Tax=Ceratodon purpureus TaxID=3225 RepID=A0A8T0GDK6_CERPU|nr:hypothetical protein KC19_11G053600 [Ceratodon purpureus]
MMQGSTSLSPTAPRHFLMTSRRHADSLHEEFPGLRDVLFVGFNQNYSSFVCGTESGIKVYSCGSLEQKICRVSSGEGFGIVEILLNSSIFALVGGGKNPFYSPKAVMLYNDKEYRFFGELAFRSPVRAVKLQPNFIVVALEFKVYVYSFETLKVLHQYETLSNIKGLCATASTGVLVCPGQRTGQVKVERFSAKTGFEIQAHETSLACLALNSNGSLLATASTKGTLINIFRTNDGTKLQELRRGTHPADIFSMAFSANSQLLVLSGSNGTVHIFRIQANVIEEPRRTEGTALVSSGSASDLFRAGSMLLSSVAATAGSSFSFVKGVMSKYLISDRSLCQFRLPSGSRATVGFGPNKNTIIILCTDGSLYECLFDPVKGGPCQLQNHFSFA